MKMDGVKDLGITLTSEQIEHFDIFLNKLVEWNKNINLTAITSKDEIITKHFLDSLSLVKAIDISKYISLLDIGSGSGFPGIPLKIVFPHLNITLVDSVKKKVNFMKNIIDSLKLHDTKAVFSRSEDLPKDQKETFDIVTSRAVADLRVLSEYCLPYVKINGYFIAYKGRDIKEELNSAKNAISTLGGELEKVVELTIPGTDIQRTLVVIKKVNKTPNNFPRRAGMAKKRPL